MKTIVASKNRIVITEYRKQNRKLRFSATKYSNIRTSSPTMGKSRTENWLIVPIDLFLAN